MGFTVADKRKALLRELAMRRNVYAKRIREGKMDAEVAAWELGVFEAILKDYYPPDPIPSTSGVNP